jgi:hypothetical protein
MTLCGLMAGCGGDSSGVTGDLSWIALPPEAEFADGNWKPVPEADVISISGDAEHAAVAQLRSVPLVQLSPEQLTAMHLKISAVDKRRAPYLVRAVQGNWAGGGIAVEAKADAIWVRYGVLSHKPVPIRRSAIVVLAERPIKTVFVSTDVAE